jgi:ubiquinone/menaquinone biosynthesis C-methylase UbiE
MKTFEISVDRFNEFAVEYEKRFMDGKINPYSDSLDFFCSKILKKKPEILDVACGPGNVTKYLKEKFPESNILAVDLAPNMIELTRKNVPGIETGVMDIRKIGEIERKFDGIMCSFCFPFLSLQDAEKMAKDIAVMLNEGGVLYISTMEGPESKAGFEKTSFSGDAEIYFNYFREEDIRRMLSENGFILDKLRKQDYKEQDGSITIDMIFIASKK